MAASLGYIIFYVPDVPAALQFYTAAFGFEQRMLTPDNDYGELATGDTTLSFVSHELAQTNLAEAGGFTPLNAATAPVGASLTIVDPDVDALVASAVSNGATPYVAPIQKPWGQTVAYVIDPSGLLLELATPISAG